MKFLVKESLVNVTKFARNCGLVTFTEKFFNEKLFLCSGIHHHFPFKQTKKKVFVNPLTPSVHYKVMYT